MPFSTFEFDKVLFVTSSVTRTQGYDSNVLMTHGKCNELGPHGASMGTRDTIASCLATTPLCKYQKVSALTFNRRVLVGALVSASTR